MEVSTSIRSAFVTGSTGLLGNNLVRMLASAKVAVKALSRSPQKAQKQFTGLNVEVIQGDMDNVPGFAPALAGCDVVFHTAAYFRESYEGGNHWDALYRTNVTGTANLLLAAYDAGVRKFLHTSSVAVLQGKDNVLTDESMLRAEADADDYYRSKILADQEVFKFLDKHPDFFAALVLPGWMHGPGDMGPTSAGRTVLDFMNRKLPGIPPGGFSVVDARDVALALILAADHGRRGERYLAAGRAMSMEEVFQALAKVSGVPSPTWKVPLPMLYVIGALGEVQSRLLKKPALIGLATVELMKKERNALGYNPAKSEKELGLHFRPVEETFRDEIAWFRQQGLLAA